MSPPAAPLHRPPSSLALPQFLAPSFPRLGLPDASRRSPRSVGYLRLSITRGCSMRCTYCRPDFDHGHDPAALNADDLAFLVSHLHARSPLRKIRLTGGEPTTRRDLPDILRRLSALGVPDLALTTNGLTLQRDASRLRDAGLRRLNVSLDSLDPARFAALTGIDGLSRVLAGLDAARAAGFAEIKLNTVVIADQNVQDLPALVRFAADQNLSLRFIELMPMGPIAEDWPKRYVSESRMRRVLTSAVKRWHPAEPAGPSLSTQRDAARRYTAELHDGRTAHVGFITPMSRHFCDTCDRLRITADGSIYPCLMDAARGNLAAAVKRRDPRALDAQLARAFAHKADVHPAVAPGIMTHLGG